MKRIDTQQMAACLCIARQRDNRRGVIAKCIIGDNGSEFPSCIDGPDDNGHHEGGECQRSDVDFPGLPGDGKRGDCVDDPRLDRRSAAVDGLGNELCLGDIVATR